MSSIFNFSGVLIGFSITLTLSCYLGAYHGKDIIKILSKKFLVLFWDVFYFAMEFKFILVKK